ncbi:hypothetical protein JHK87_028171 [Glycine soja]|nr:hypothetical protein JHK87_028171 [Glycine soja]
MLIFSVMRGRKSIPLDKEHGMLASLTLQKTVRSEVDKMILTDAPVLFPSRQLALAAFRNSNALHKVINFDRGEKQKKSKRKSKQK